MLTSSHSLSLSSITASYLLIIYSTYYRLHYVPPTQIHMLKL